MSECCEITKAYVQDLKNEIAAKEALIVELSRDYRDADSSAVMYQKNQDDLQEELEKIQEAVENHCKPCVVCSPSCSLYAYSPHKEGNKS